MSMPIFQKDYILLGKDLGLGHDRIVIESYQTNEFQLMCPVFKGKEGYYYLAHYKLRMKL